MSSATSALKASRSIVDSYVSSSERSDLTTTFTEHTPTHSNTTNTIMKTVMNIVKHPKFKWIIIAGLLCICVFFYFKKQNKQIKKEQLEDTRLNSVEISQSNDGRPILVNKEKVYMDKIKQLENKIQENIQQSNLAQKAKNQPSQSQPQPQHQPQHQSQHQSQHQHQPQHQPQQAQYVSQMDDTESSDEVFIENSNVMNHNLTMDEMNAIDKQLEDININDMGYESD